MAIKETSKPRLSFDIPGSIPLTIESSNGLDVITWPTVVSVWETLRELKKFSGVGSDQVSLFSLQGKKSNSVKLGSIKQLQKTDVDQLVGAEIYDETTEYKLIWERYLDTDNIFIAGISGWDLTFQEKRLKDVLRITGGIAIESVIEPLVGVVLSELSSV
jgi:hypothetical protein